MSLYKQYKSDESLEKTGIVLEFGPNSKGEPMTIRVARAGGANNAYIKKAEQHLKPYRRQIQTETIDRKLLERKMLETFVDGCMLGWDNIEDENGNELTFSRDNAIKLFTDLPDLYVDVQAQANKAALFRAELTEADSGN
jgi:hypothetical protein